MGSYQNHHNLRETRMNSEESMKEERVAGVDSSMIGNNFRAFAVSELGFGEDVDFGIEEESIGSSNAIVPNRGSETPCSSSKIITRKELGVQENSAVDETSLKTRGKKNLGCSVTELKLIEDREPEEQLVRYFKYLILSTARIEAQKIARLPEPMQAPRNPDGFNLSKFWDAFFPLPTSATLAYIYGMDGTLPPVGTNVGGSLDIRLTVGHSLARALPTLYFILKIPLPISDVQLLMRRIVNTMTFVNEPPPIREIHWRVMALLFIEALAVYRLRALNQHLANARVPFFKVLDCSQITEKEYKAIRVLLIPFGKTPYF